MADPKTPGWYAKPFTLSFPVGILAVLATVIAGGATAGGVGIVTRDGDLSAVEAVLDAKVDASAAELRKEAEAARDADDALSLARYEEIVRRLDRIERTLDQR